MKFTDIKNQHIAINTLLIMGVFICLGAFYSFFDYGNKQDISKSNNSFVVEEEKAKLLVSNLALVTIKDKTYSVEIAKTANEREIGLSNRDFLPENTGMLFVFENSDIYAFWMKETLIPLDIIWISEGQKIVYIEKNAQPGTYPTVYKPTKKALFVLELAGGESDKNFFEVGDQVSFSSALTP